MVFRLAIQGFICILHNFSITPYIVAAVGPTLLLVDQDLNTNRRQFAQINDITVAHADAAV